MAKKNTKNAGADTATRKDTADAIPVDSGLDTKTDGRESKMDYDDVELEFLQVDLGDILKVKQVLDEATASAILDFCNYEEDFRTENIKLALMFAACCFAMVAQFAPLPFPESRYILGGCCVIYFLLSGLLQLLITFFERDAIMITKPKVGSPNSQEGKGIRVRSCFPRFDEYYCVVLEFEGVADSPFVEQKWSVSEYFDVEGMFDEEEFMDEVQRLVVRFESGDYDSAEKKDEDPKIKGD